MIFVFSFILLTNSRAFSYCSLMVFTSIWAMRYNIHRFCADVTIYFHYLYNKKYRLEISCTPVKYSLLKFLIFLSEFWEKKLTVSSSICSPSQIILKMMKKDNSICSAIINIHGGSVYRIMCVPFPMSSWHPQWIIKHGLNLFNKRTN